MAIHTPTRKSDIISALTQGTGVKNKKDGEQAAKQLNGRLGKIYGHLQKARLEATLIGQNESKDLNFLKKGVKAITENLDALAEHVNNLRQSSKETLSARQSATQTKTTPSASAPRRNGR